MQKAKQNNFLTFSQEVKSEPKLMSFEKKKITALERENQAYKKRYAELFSNAQASKADFDRLQHLNGALSKQSRLLRLSWFVEWFIIAYEPAKAHLIIRTPRANRISSPYIKYRPQLYFWDESLKAIFDIEEISFAPLTKRQSQKLLGSERYQSAGIIPFRVNWRYLTRRLATNGLNEKQAMKAWLIFADDKQRFLPDSSQALDFLQAMQTTLNQNFQS